MRIVILVPFRGDNGGRRDILWSYMRERLECEHPNMLIYEGVSPDGLFNRAAALNDAAQRAGVWDVAVIHDADSWVPIDQFNQAVHDAGLIGRLVAAFTSVVELDEKTSEHYLVGDSDFEIAYDRIRTEEVAIQSSVLAVRRDLWDRVGGFDPGFDGGWGGEDGAFWEACRILGGPPWRIDGPAYHLWHPPANPNRRRDPGYRRNLRRWQLYSRARTEQDLARMRQ